MPDYLQRAAPGLDIPPALPPRAPDVLEIEPWAWAAPSYHLHHWGTDLRCVDCHWSLGAVLARAQAHGGHV